MSVANKLQMYRVFLENKSYPAMKKIEIVIAEQFIPTFPIN